VSCTQRGCGAEIASLSCGERFVLVQTGPVIGPSCSGETSFQSTDLHFQY
jgi:hypothetical protein